MSEEILDQNPAAPVLDASQKAPLPEVDGTNSPDPSAESEQAANEQQDDKRRGNYIPQWRVDEITRNHREAERRAAEAERKLEERDRELAALKPSQAQSASQRPKPPDINTFSGTTEEFNRAMEAYDRNLETFLDARNQERETKRQADQLLTEVRSKLKELPDYAEVSKAKESFGKDVIDFMEVVAAGAGRFGPQAVREILLDPDLSEQLRSLDKIKNGNGITALVHTVAALLVKSKDSAKVEDKTPTSAKSSSAPKPAEPVNRATGAKTGIYDGMSYKDFCKVREAQLQGK